MVAAVYAAFFDEANRLELTAVDIEPDGDAFFPTWDQSQWTRVDAMSHRGPPPYEFQTWARLAERDA